jgi:hypothetical protein
LLTILRELATCNRSASTADLGSRASLTITLIITSLVVTATVSLVLIELSLSTILSRGVVAALVVVLLILWHVAAAVSLAGLKCWRSGLEGLHAGSERTRLWVLLVDVQLLLCLSRQVVVLRRRIIFPRVKVGHYDDVFGDRESVDGCQFRRRVVELGSLNVRSGRCTSMRGCFRHAGGEQVRRQLDNGDSPGRHSLSPSNLCRKRQIQDVRLRRRWAWVGTLNHGRVEGNGFWGRGQLWQVDV